MNIKLTGIVYDESPIFRFGMLTLLRNIPEMDSVSELPAIKDYKEIFEKKVFDVAVIGLNNIKCIESLNSISSLYPQMKIILLLNKTEDLYYEDVFKLPADAFLLKNCDFKDVKIALLEVFQGKKYYCPQILDRFKSGNSNKIILKKSAIANKNILYIMHLMYYEKTSKEIAGILNLSLRTVEDYRTKILKITNSENMVGVIKYIVEEGIHVDEYLLGKFSSYCSKKNHSEVDYIR